MNYLGRALSNPTNANKINQIKYAFITTYLYDSHPFHT